MAPHVVDNSGGLIATPGDPHDEDPRRLRSRARLLDAATDLLKTGGAEAVTVEDCVRIVDDFLAARAAASPRYDGPSP